MPEDLVLTLLTVNVDWRLESFTPDNVTYRCSEGGQLDLLMVESNSLQKASRL